MAGRAASCLVLLMGVTVAAAPAAAQWVNPDTCSWANASCQQANKEKDERSQSDAAFRKEMAEREARRAKAEEQRRRTLLRAPPLPAERNPLLGSWRLDAGERSNAGGPGRETARHRAVTDLMNTFSIAGIERYACATWFGGGVSFTPSTYARRGTGSVLDGAGSAEGGVAYRFEQSGAKRLTVAIPSDARQSMLSFEVTGAGRLVSTAGCVLVRGDAPVHHAAAPPAGAQALVVDGAGFRCSDGGLYQVTGCRGDATCDLTELHRPLPAVGFHMPTRRPRADIVARVQSCESGGFRFAPDGKPIFVK